MLPEITWEDGGELVTAYAATGRLTRALEACLTRMTLQASKLPDCARALLPVYGRQHLAQRCPVAGVLDRYMCLQCLQRPQLRRLIARD